MKNIFVKSILFIILVATTCCNKEESSICQNNITDTTVDTSYYISFDIDTTRYIFYQTRFRTTWKGHYYDSTSNIWAYSYMNDYEFGCIDPGSYDMYNPLPIRILFLNYTLNEEHSDYLSVSSWLEPEHKFTHQINKQFTIDDTIFLNGVSMRYYDYSTKTILENFNYNLDSINDFFENNSVMKFDKKISVCNDYHLVEGQFSTKLMNDLDQQLTRNIENGKFKFLIK